MPWGNILDRVRDWAIEVNQENEAVDPWQEEVGKIADDDSAFTFNELPRIDRAIDASLEELKKDALGHGIKLDRIESELTEVKQLLQKAARNSTKKDWLNIFKGAIVSKLLDWGMSLGLLTSIAHVMVSAAQDIAQLTEHASRIIPGQ